MASTAVASWGFSVQGPRDWEEDLEDDFVSYGDEIAFIQFTGIEKTEDLEVTQWMDNTISALAEDTPFFEVLDQGEVSPERVGGYPARWVGFQGLWVGQPIRQFMVLVDQGDQGLSVVCAAPTTSYDQYASQFRAVLESLQIR